METLDRVICRKIHMTTMTWGAFEYLMAVSAASFNNEIAAFIWSLALLQLPWSRRSMLLAFVIPAVTFISVFVLKNLISRERPTPHIPRSHALKFDFRGKERKSKSMPSGDSAQSAAFWTCMVINGVIPWWCAIVFTSCTMTARVYYMCHYPSDTVMGALLGVLISGSVNLAI